MNASSFIADDPSDGNEPSEVDILTNLIASEVS